MADLVDAHGSAKRPERDVAKQRPDGLDDATVEALGNLSEALEVIEVARGLLYEFHRMSGTADRTLQEAVDGLRKAGHAELADEIDEVLVGRDILPGLWTFQIVEGYDEAYYRVFKDVEQKAGRGLARAPKHLYEAEMKYGEQQPR